MIIAGILLLTGILIGLSYRYPVLLLASLGVTLAAFPLWFARGELGLLSIAVWFGYLSALQGGFLLGGYLDTAQQQDGWLSEPDRQA